jgi:hypothetical protein
VVVLMALMGAFPAVAVWAGLGNMVSLPAGCLLVFPAGRLLLLPLIPAGRWFSAGLLLPAVDSPAAYLPAVDLPAVVALGRSGSGRCC